MSLVENGFPDYGGVYGATLLLAAMLTSLSSSPEISNACTASIADEESSGKGKGKGKVITLQNFLFIYFYYCS